jgi:hypothetical protein
VLATHRIGVRDDLAVVLVDGLRGPADAVRLLREVDVDEPWLLVKKELFENPLEPRFEDREGP